MKQIRQTEVVKAAVEYQGEVRATGGEVKLRPGGGKRGSGLPPQKVSVQDMIDEIRAKFAISDEESLYIKQVTEEKTADPVIRHTVHAHRDDYNHPVGPLEPSAADEEATAQLKAAGAVLGIALLDHMIFNRTGYFSFLESGRL